MDHADLVRVVAAEAARFSALARAVDHAAPLPHLPGWTAGDAVAHLAGDFRWATGILTTRAPTRSGLVHEKASGTVLCDLFDELTAGMVAALGQAAAAPGAPCPNFAEGPRGVLGWWPRHQAHETTLHRWDLEVPTGAHAPIAPALADDGVDELLHVYTRRYGPHALDAPLVLRSTTGRAWRLVPTGRRGRLDVQRLAGPGGPAARASDEAEHEADLEAEQDGDLEAEQDAEQDAAVEGGPEALLLVLWRRLDPAAAGLRTGGHDAALRALLDGPVTA